MRNVNVIIESIKAQSTKAIRDIESTTVFKNGEELKALRIQLEETPNIVPIFYLTEDDRTDEQLVKDITSMLNNPAPTFNMELMTSKEFLEKNAILCVSNKPYNERAAVRKWLDIYEYVRVIIPSDSDESKGTFVIEKSFLESHPDVTKDWLFKTAKKNAMEKFISRDFLGMPIVTTEDGMYGGAAIAIKEYLDKYCDKKGIKKLLILPSSVHELILFDADTYGEKTEADELVRNVTETQVAEKDRLSYHAYIYDRETRKESV